MYIAQTWKVKAPPELRVHHLFGNKGCGVRARALRKILSAPPHSKSCILPGCLNNMSEQGATHKII